MDKETLVNNLKRSWIYSKLEIRVMKVAIRKHIDDNDFIEVHITDNVGYCIEYYKENRVL